MEEMETDIETPQVPLWEELKTQLDEELVPDQVEQMRYLMKDNICPEQYPHLKTPSDLLTYLENNMAGDEAWTIVEHVFRYTKDYFQFETSSIADIVNRYKKMRARFTCSTFIGRQDDVRNVLETLDSIYSKGVWIHGFGGLGKTSLAHEVCAKMSEEWEIIRVDLKQTTTPLEFVRQILKFVVKSIKTSSDLDTLLDMIVLPKEGKYCVLLDNIECAFLNNQCDTIKVLNRCFEMSKPTIKWIMTCRVPPVHDKKPKFHPQIAQFELKPLDESYSRKLLKIRAKPKVIKQDFTLAILQSTNGNPLAIELLGGAIKRWPDDVTSFLISGISKPGEEMESVLSFTHDSLSPKTQRSLLELSVVGSSEFDIKLASAILETKFDETVMMMIELTNRHVVQRVEWKADSERIKKNSSKPQVELEYCIHPLLLRYLENKQTVENVHKAQQNFCKYVFKKMEKESESVDINYSLAKDTVLVSDGLYRSMYQVLTRQIFTKSTPLQVSTCIYLSKLAELVQLPEENKIMLYRNIIEHSPEKSAFFWHIETMATHIDMRRFQDAHDTLNRIESKLENNYCEDSFTMGFYWYQKGRYCRMKEKYQHALYYHDKAMDCFIKCRYVIGMAHAQNAKGNVYFDRGEYEDAKAAHEKAKDTLKAYVQNDHPDLSTYDFNIGTVCLAIAEQKRKQNHGQSVMNEELKTYYETALDKFKESLKRDEVMGMTKSTQYTTKLDNIAWCYYRLGHFDDGIATLQELVEVVNTPSPTRKTVTVYFTAGKAYMDWSHKSETDMKRRLIKEAAKCFYKVQSILYDGFPTIDLSDIDKRDYIEYFKELAANLSRERKMEVERFCQRYEAGNLCTSDSSSDSSDCCSSSHDSSASNSDEGMEAEDCNSGDEYKGIPSAELEKMESEQFEKSFLTETNSAPQVGKRPHSSSDSD